jgi:type I restriction-modification system DNA methylase subunit
LVLKRCKKPDDVLFINAAAHFEKGKRQNQLLPEHIEKIVLSGVKRLVWSCCLKRKCYRRISFVLAQNLTSIAMRLFRASAPFCRILIVVGEAEPGNGGDQPVKE